jgi:hypothetical protein
MRTTVCAHNISTISVGHKLLTPLPQAATTADQNLSRDNTIKRTMVEFVRRWTIRQLDTAEGPQAWRQNVSTATT